MSRCFSHLQGPVRNRYNSFPITSRITSYIIQAHDVFCSQTNFSRFHKFIPHFLHFNTDYFLQEKYLTTICQKVFQKFPDFVRSCKDEAFEALSDPMYSGKMKVQLRNKGSVTCSIWAVSVVKLS